MSLSSDERRALKAQSHAIKAKIIIGRGGLNEAIVDQVRQALAHQALVKVRAPQRETAEVDALGRQLVAAVPCELVGRTGFVMTLYRRGEGGAEPTTD